MNKEMGEPQLENKEDEQKFNFEEIEEIEPAILSLISPSRKNPASCIALFTFLTSPHLPPIE